MTFLDLVQSAEGHTAHGLLLRHGEHLDVLNKVVTELAIELPFDVLQFLDTLLGEGCTQILTHHLLAVELPHNQTA